MVSLQTRFDTEAKDDSEMSCKHGTPLFNDRREGRGSELGSLSKPVPRRRRQRERHQTKGLMSKTIIAVHVRYNFLYISLPASAKQQREMTKFCAVYGTWITTANISHFHLELYAVAAYLT